MKNNSIVNGFNLLVTTEVVFVTMKLAGVVKWSWLWVLSPAWFGVLVVLGFWIIYAGMTVYLAHLRRKAQDPNSPWGPPPEGKR